MPWVDEPKNPRGQVCITSVKMWMGQGAHFSPCLCACLVSLVLYLQVIHIILRQTDLRILWLLGQMYKSTYEISLWGSSVEDLIHNAVVFRDFESQLDCEVSHSTNRVTQCYDHSSVEHLEVRINWRTQVTVECLGRVQFAPGPLLPLSLLPVCDMLPLHDVPPHLGAMAMELSDLRPNALKLCAEINLYPF